MILDGKYEILQQIGQGGMSIVYLARDLRLQKQWAIKQVRQNEKADEVKIQSLISEVNLMKKLDHPALPRIVDILKQDGQIYIVMDYVQGESLAEVLRREGAQKEADVRNWAILLADVLRYLHHLSPPIIYRDMKPSNVMLTPEGNLKLIDFGIAREYKHSVSTDTTVLGTQGYAPPEQHGSRQTDARSDIYALGMTLHHLLTGLDPGQPDYSYQSPRTVRKGISEGFSWMIDRCTALQPEDRYQSCEEFLHDLQHVDELGANSRKRKQRRIRMTFGVLMLSGLFAASGVWCNYQGMQLSQAQYEQLLYAKGDGQENLSDCLKAIDMEPSNPAGLIRLLELYQENGRFGDEESRQFHTLFSEHKQELSEAGEDYEKLLYTAGMTYCHYYTGADQSFRVRLLMAKKYFAEMQLDDNEMGLYPMAYTYLWLGEFYESYVVQANAGDGGQMVGLVEEPGKEEYDKMLEILQQCMDHMQQRVEIPAYVRLLFMNETMNLLYDQRRGMASAGVDENQVIDLVDRIWKAAPCIVAAQQESLDLQTRIIENYMDYRDHIEQSFSNSRP